MKMGEKIKKIREEKGLSQQDLADKIKHLNQAQVSKIETGARKITALDLESLSKILGVSVEVIISKDV